MSSSPLKGKGPLEPGDWKWMKAHVQGNKDGHDSDPESSVPSPLRGPVVAPHGAGSDTESLDSEDAGRERMTEGRKRPLRGPSASKSPSPKRRRRGGSSAEYTDEEEEWTASDEAKATAREEHAKLTEAQVELRKQSLDKIRQAGVTRWTTLHDEVQDLKLQVKQREDEMKKLARHICPLIQELRGGRLALSEFEPSEVPCMGGDGELRACMVMQPMPAAKNTQMQEKLVLYAAQRIAGKYNLDSKEVAAFAQSLPVQFKAMSAAMGPPKVLQLRRWYTSEDKKKRSAALRGVPPAKKNEESMALLKLPSPAISSGLAPIPATTTPETKKSPLKSPALDPLAEFAQTNPNS